MQTASQDSQRKPSAMFHVFWSAQRHLDQPSRTRSAGLYNGASFLLIWSEGSKVHIHNQAPHARVQGCLLPLRYKPSGCVCENVEWLQRKTHWPAGKDWLFITLHGQSMHGTCQDAEFWVTDPRAVHHSSCQVTLGWREGRSPLEVKCFKENKNKKATTMMKQTIRVSDGNSLISFVCVNYKWGGKACPNLQPRLFYTHKSCFLFLLGRFSQLFRERYYHTTEFPALKCGQRICFPLTGLTHRPLLL